MSQAPVLDLGAGSYQPRERTPVRPHRRSVFGGGHARRPGHAEGGLTRRQRRRHSGGRDAARRLVRDTWVLSQGPVNASFTPLATTVGEGDLASATEGLVARRREPVLARPLRRALRGRCTAVAPGVVASARRLGRGGRRPVPCARWRCVRGCSAPSRPTTSTPRCCARRHPIGNPRGLELGRLAQVASACDGCPADHWRTLNRLQSDPVFRRDPLSIPLSCAGAASTAQTAMTTLFGLH